MALVDLHFHTRWSDGQATPHEAVALARERGVRVAITDHNTIEGALEAWRLAGESASSLVVPGIEITTLERVHLLLWFRGPEDLARFFARSVAPYRPRGFTPTTVLPRKAEELIDELRGWDHLRAAAHPYALARNGWMSARSDYGHLRELLTELDAVEVLNGQELDSGNTRSSELARVQGLGRVAGSDGHTLGELGLVGLQIPDGEDLFDSVRAGVGEVVDRRPRRLLDPVRGHGAKAPYFAALPFRAGYRWVTRRSGDGPLTSAAVGDDGEP